MVYHEALGTVIATFADNIFGYGIEAFSWSQSRWISLTGYPFGSHFESNLGLAYDSARQRVVACTTDEGTWEIVLGPGASVVTTQPSPAMTCPSGAATFSASSSGSGPFTYQWQWQQRGSSAWTILTEGPNAEPTGVVRFIATGALAPTVIVSRDNHLQGAVDVIQAVRCIFSNACGNATSNPVTLTICVADTDDGSGTGTRDGGVTIDDLLYFLSIFEQGLFAADMDDGSGTGAPDGGVTIDDLLYYLQRYEAGC